MNDGGELEAIGPLPMRSAGDHPTRQLLAEHLPRVRALLHRFADTPQDLDDMTQEALIELAKALPSFEGRARLSTFVHTITVRVAYRWLATTRKRRARETRLELVPPPVDRIDPESQAMARQALRAMYGALEGLSDTMRVAFVLCELDGMDPAEAAAIEGITPGAMRTRLSRAKTALLRRLDTDPYVAEMRKGGTRG